MGLRSHAMVGNRYRLGALLGRGGMADVYEAVDTRLGRPVAIKVLRPEMAVRAEIRRRFEAEAQAAARLTHPNVVAVFDAGEDVDESGARTAWIAMERLPGETLADRMAAGPVDTAWLLRLAGDVLGALGAAHDAGIVHRDIKPGNILIAADGCAKVADFGIAKSLEASDDATNTSTLIGTPAYLSPERLDGSPATRQSDLYALGVVLYEALAGGKPFRGDTPVSLAYAVQHADVPPLDHVRPDVPPRVVAAVHRAMDRDPARRFATAADMSVALGLEPSGVEPDATVLDAMPSRDATLVLERDGAGPVAGAAPSSPRPRSPAFVAALVMLLVTLAVIGMSMADDGDRSDVVARDLRALADQLRPQDGRRAADAARSLRAVAGAVEAGDGSADDRANVLLTLTATWQATEELSASAASRMRRALTRVPGADPAAFAVPTTTSPPTTEPPARGEDEDDDKDDGRGGGEKKGKGRGD